MAWDLKGILFQILLIGLAVGLPSAAHLTGAPVRVLLPMHWPVILAGLVYGWRGGLTTGILSPVTSYLISGMPFPAMIFPMSLELGTYGLVVGLLRETRHLNPFLAAAVAIFAGRIVFLATVLYTGSYSGTFPSYLQTALLPGLGAAVGQIVLLPLMSKWWLSKASSGLGA